MEQRERRGGSRRPWTEGGKGRTKMGYLSHINYGLLTKPSNRGVLARERTKESESLEFTRGNAARS